MLHINNRTYDTIRVVLNELAKVDKSLGGPTSEALLVGILACGDTLYISKEDCIKYMPNETKKLYVPVSKFVMSYTTPEDQCNLNLHLSIALLRIKISNFVTDIPRTAHGLLNAAMVYDPSLYIASDVDMFSYALEYVNAKTQ